MATVRQKLAIQKVVENHGNVSAAMKAAGYADNTAKNPSNLTTSKAFKELVKDKLPDEKLIDKLNEGLEASRTISTISGKQANGGTVDFVDVPDYAVQHKFLETALKIKGHLGDRMKMGFEELPDGTRRLLLDIPLD